MSNKEYFLRHIIDKYTTYKKLCGSPGVPF